MGDPAVALRAGKIAESVAADDRAGLEHHAPPDAGARGSTPLVGPITLSSPTVTPSPSDTPSASRHRSPRCTSRPSTVNGPMETSAPRTHPAPMRAVGSTPGRGGGGGKQRAHGPHQGAVGIAHDDPRGGPPARRQRVGHEHRAGTGRLELVRVPGRDREGERLGPGASRAGAPRGAPPPIAKQAAADQIGDRLRSQTR